MKDQEFTKSREVLSARKRDLVVNNAKGNRPQAAGELIDVEEDLLFQTGQFGEDDPEVLATRCGGYCLSISSVERETNVEDWRGVSSSRR